MNDPLSFSEHILSSGLTVFFQRREVPWFECVMIVGVGARHDPPDKEGLSHLLEHCLSTGTQGMEQMNLVELQRWIAAQQFIFDLGGTNFDCTLFQGKTFTRHAKRFFRFLEGFLRRPLLESVDHEREIIRREREEALNPKRREMFRVRREAVFGRHPLSRMNAIPEDAVLDGLTVEDIREMHRRYYRCPNMKLVVIGGLRRDRLLRTLEGVFSPENKGFIPIPRPPPVDLGVPEPREIRERFHDGQAQTVDIEYVWHLPPQDHTHLVILREILREILMERLREQLRLTYNVSCDNDRNLDHSTFTISTEVEPDKVDQAREEIERIITCLPLIESVFPMKKAEYCTEMGFIDLTVGEIIGVVAKTVAIDGKPRTLKEATERYASIGQEDISRLLRDFINPERAFVEIIEW